MSRHGRGNAFSDAGKMMGALKQIQTLPGLIDRAAKALSSARSAAEVLDAREMASVIYDAAKKAARFAKAKHAHDDLITAARRSQADALEIEALAETRLADEYDAAQERGEVETRGGDRKSIKVPEQNFDKAQLKDLGLTKKDVSEARAVRDAEEADPGIVRRTLDDRLEAGAEPTKAALRKAIKGAVVPKKRPPKKAKPKPPSHTVVSPIDRCAAHVRSTVFGVLTEISKDDWPTLFERLHAELDDLEAKNGNGVPNGHHAARQSA